MKGHWKTYDEFADSYGPKAKLETGFLCAEGPLVNYWLVNIRDTHSYRLWLPYDGDRSKKWEYQWSDWEPLPEGLTLEEAKAYTMLMWRMQ